MTHDHACIGAAATYSVVVAIALGLSTFAFGLFVAEHAARALWTRIERLWTALGEVEESRRIDR